MNLYLFLNINNSCNHSNFQEDSDLDYDKINQFHIFYLHDNEHLLNNDHAYYQEPQCYRVHLRHIVKGISHYAFCEKYYVSNSMTSWLNESDNEL